MPETDSITQPIEKISHTVELLDDTSKQLIEVMDDQIDAVISSDPDKVEELTDIHTALRGEFKKYEKRFVEELKKALYPVSNPDRSLRLVTLKQVFPESASSIDRWKELLTDNTKRLQQRQGQLLKLLEFAMNRNATMMRSIYGMYNEKNAHYSANGDKAGTFSGVAINQEI